MRLADLSMADLRRTLRATEQALGNEADTVRLLRRELVRRLRRRRRRAAPAGAKK